MPRYRIEYLSESTEEDSVCHVRIPSTGVLAEAGREAMDFFLEARDRFHANGFQIRDMEIEGLIVALETPD